MKLRRGDVVYLRLVVTAPGTSRGEAPGTILAHPLADNGTACPIGLTGPGSTLFIDPLLSPALVLPRQRQRIKLAAPPSRRKPAKKRRRS